MEKNKRKSFKENASALEHEKDLSNPTRRSPQISQLHAELEAFKEESQEIQKTMEFLQDENDVLKKSAIDINKLHFEAEYYKNMAESGLKEASTLAEQIISLRKNLDLSHSKFLKIQRQQIVLEKSEEAPLSTGRSSLKSERSSKGSGIKKVVRWKDELEESTTCLQLLEQASQKSRGFN